MTSSLKTFSAPLTEHEHCVPQEIWEDYYELSRILEWVSAGSFQRIGLQFPPYLTPDSATVARKLSSHIRGEKAQFYILADTTYTSCCVDLITAEHVGCDAIVHFGRWCGSSPASGASNILHVYGKDPLDLGAVNTSIADIKANTGSEVVFVCADSPWRWAVPGMLNTGVILYDPSSTSAEAVEGPILCISPDNMFFQNLCLTTKNPKVFRFDPTTSAASSPMKGRTSMLARRIGKIQKASGAGVWGVLVTTMSKAGYFEQCQRLLRMLRESGKSAYLIYVGVVNTEKLCNFPEIDAWVVVGCPETEALELDSFKPVLSPFELERMLQEDWSGSYSVDWGSSQKELVKRDMALIDRATGLGAAGLYLRRVRTYKGLGEVELEDVTDCLEDGSRQPDYAVLEEGQTGIASAYRNEPRVSDRTTDW